MSNAFGGWGSSTNDGREQSTGQTEPRFGANPFGEAPSVGDQTQSPFGASPAGGQPPFGEKPFNETPPDAGQSPFGGASAAGGQPPFGAAPGLGGSPFGNAQPAQSQNPFGTSAVASAASTATQRPGRPLLWLGLSCLASVLGVLGALLLPASLVYLLLAWLFCGPIAILLTAVYATQDTKMRTLMTYSPPAWARIAYWCTLGLSFASILVVSLTFALWAGRL
ncbi:hypothetical protein F8O06_09720 [Pseudoclavibacter sp. CFCC 14310]|uniref:hypothetical protein n=1 Tax=Pseudoclavibacter sp. CFCC 14310 TaxID=2615180 RepID=UPI0013017D2D|nr:hypothetical protein [Pseudoclavibacter sp. CFCC 14310]KAB1644322.1 hypothetical protein F8O06_09720 [Pseudoclavibacter sp. CFCC 14310]